MNKDSPGDDHMLAGCYMSNTESLRVEEKKIVHYLLNRDHKYGSGKAKFFMDLGFSTDKWCIFANALKTHAKDNPIAKKEEHDWGVKYVVECNIITPNDETYCIRTVWNDRLSARLITAHALRPD